MLVIDQVLLQRGAWQRFYQLSVSQGEIVTLQGRSGTGKSALLMAIAGFEPVSRGDIRWQEQSLLPWPVEKRPVSLLFQDHNLFEHLSVEQNLKLGLQFADQQEGKKAIRAAAEALDITAYLQRRPSELSGGQRQRVALLRTLLRPEGIILLDEPFAELDAYTRELAGQWVRKQAKQTAKAVLLVTHQSEDVERVGDRNIVLD